ncbi:MAG: hypothetical protein AAF969_12345 [Bacteroidota bacterium]
MFKKLLAVLTILITIQYGMGQTPGNPTVKKESPVSIDGFDYPQFDKYSNFAWFRTKLRLSNTTEFSIGGDHFRSYAADRITIPIELRQYISNKTYLMGGFQLEWDLMNENQGAPNPIPRNEVFYGLGHDVRPNWSLEARVVSPMGDPKFQKFGLEGVETRFELGTRLKF